MTDPRNLLSEKELKRAQREHSINEKNLRAGLGHLLSAATGRMWLWHQLTQLGLMGGAVGQTPALMDGARLDLLARTDERKKIAQELMNACESSFPDETRLMFLEHMQRADLDAHIAQAKRDREAAKGESNDGTG